MDEVDLILHPLRSELNFPIGDKLDLDFNPLRFILFYFILFYFILFYFILFYFILFYFILFYFILFYFILLFFFFSLFTLYLKLISLFFFFFFFRWRLPFHIFDAIFFAESQKLYGDLRDSETSLQILNQFKKVVEEGFATKSLQKNPHIVLLDLDFYRLKMRPILTEWVIMWLNYHHFSGLNQSQVFYFYFFFCCCCFCFLFNLFFFFFFF